MAGQTWESKPRLIDRQKRIAIPPEIMEAMGVGVGDYLAFTLEGQKVSLHRVKWSREK